MMGNWGWGPSMMGSWGIGFGILNILFWLLIIIGVIYLIKRLAGGCRHRGHTGHDDDGSALRILKERYARGEIKKEEFEEKIKDLSG